MGFKKSGKRLLKLGQKAARELGKDGRAWVEKVFQTAFEVIEGELSPKKKVSASEHPAPAERGGHARATRSTANPKATSTKAKGRRSNPQALTRKLGKAAARPPVEATATPSKAKRPRAKPKAPARKRETAQRKQPQRRRALASVAPGEPRPGGGAR
jgi:hypothetical protein